VAKEHASSKIASYKETINDMQASPLLELFNLSLRTRRRSILSQLFRIHRSLWWRL